MKYISKIILISFIFSNQIVEQSLGQRSSIFIYHSGKAMVNENRELKINQNGKLDFNIISLPSQMIDTGIQIHANNFKLNTFSIVRDLVTEKFLLNYFVGEKIILKDFESNKTIDATLMSFKNNTSVYVTENGVIVNPNLKPIFPFIPENYKEEIFIKVSGTGNLGTSNLNLSYFTESINWETEYHLILNDDDKATLNANYQIQNKTDKSYPLSEIFLIASNNIEKSPSNNRVIAKMAVVENSDNSSYQPSSIEIDDVTIYKIPNKLSMEKKSNINSSFISPTQIKMKKKFIASHTPNYFDRGRRKNLFNSLNPTDIFIELNSNGKIKSHLPKGKLNIYEIKEGQKMFIGNKFISKTSKGNPIYFHFKKSQDILHSFNQIEFEENNKGYRITINAEFKNLKDKTSEVIWQERPGRIAEILNSSIEFNEENIFEFNSKISLEAFESRKETLTLFIPKRD
tara:strand:- start:6437 stop:7810 length:1374 start_codon:yes stop_codon:yes gene_type:complete